MLETIRDGVKEVAKERYRCQILEINSIIDIQLISQQVVCGAFDWGLCLRLVRSVVSVIERMQDSKRAEETRLKYAALCLETEKVSAVAAEQDLSSWPFVLCKALQFLANRVDVLRIDAANGR